MTQRTWAAASLRVKYTWPEAARTRFDISPVTQVSGMPRSSVLRARRLSSLTERGTLDKRVREDGGGGRILADDYMCVKQAALSGASDKQLNYMEAGVAVFLYDFLRTPD